MMGSHHAIPKTWGSWDCVSIQFQNFHWVRLRAPWLKVLGFSADFGVRWKLLLYTANMGTVGNSLY